MQVSNALAGVAVNDATQASKWYSQIAGQPGSSPMPGVHEWTFPRGGVLQVFEDPNRAGHSSVTLSVPDLQQTVACLRRFGVEILQETDSADVSTAQVRDPDGNQVVFAQQHTSRVAG